MKEFPDDELDKLFRKSAEELDSTFDPNDWNALKGKLDEHDGKTPGALFKKWWPIGLLTLLFVAGLTTFVLTRVGEIKNINQIPVESQFPEKRKNVDSENVEKNTEKPVGNELASETKSEVTNKAIKKNSEIAKVNVVEPKKEISTEKTSEKKLISKAESKKKLPRRWSKTGGVYLEPDRSIGRRVDGAFYSKNKISKSSGSKERSSLNEESVILEDNKANTETKSGEFKISKKGENDVSFSPITDNQNNAGLAVNLNAETVSDRFLIRADLLKSRSFVFKKSNKLPEIENVEVQQISEPVKSVSDKEASPKFAVRFGFSPDLSSVGLKNFTKPGTAVSLLIEYSFLPKLYFQTGLIRSSKGYNAKPGEYEWPSSWNDQKARPISVDAICKVIEVPLNFRYDISKSDRSRWFVGAGASSYYMQNEKYDYNYAPHTYNIIWYEHEAATGWYWLSHLNASAGYEYRFSKKLSLLAEPYVRVPIRKVGYGKVNLFSAGVWFSIRYTPVFK